ncbi:hypothetical protein Bca4012_088437 [Brassica carinata]
MTWDSMAAPRLFCYAGSLSKGSDVGLVYPENMLSELMNLSHIQPQAELFFRQRHEDFASKNYTIITSKCKGPNYPAKACCSAFKDFACPFAEALNDEKADCASTMFSYINIYGRYPPGIFANMCKEGKEGLDCSNVTATSSAHASLPLVSSTHAMLITVLFFYFF